MMQPMQPESRVVYQGTSATVGGSSQSSYAIPTQPYSAPALSPIPEGIRPLVDESMPTTRVRVTLCTG